MANRKRIDHLLRSWPYDPQELNVRRLPGRNGAVIQMRVDLGVLQMEIDGRPDGARPGGADTYYDHLLTLRDLEGDDFELDEEQCEEVDREFVQFYHRRICFLKLRDYRRAARDADHSLRLMDFCRQHSPDDQWTLSHEQYRPFVLFHRVQSSTLAELREHGATAAVRELDDGVATLRGVFRDRGAEDSEEEAEFLGRLSELRQSLVHQFDARQGLEDELQRAVAEERYEDAARLRDELAGRED